MATEFDSHQVQHEQVEEHISRDDVSTILKFLCAAGFLPAFTPVVKPEASKDVVMSGLTEAVTVLTWDVSEKADSFRRRL